MKIIKNYTPHDIRIVLKTGEITLPSQGVARITSYNKVVGDFNGIPIMENVFDVNASILPPEEDGTIYVVSSIVKTLTGRKDFAVPGKLIRNDRGDIIACGGLIL